MIDILNLSKKYGKATVLESIDLRIKKGRTTAILGPNGSGKSTLLKCILGLVNPYTGYITIDSKPIKDTVAYRRNIGYMPQIAKFPPNLKVKEVLQLVNHIRNGNGHFKYGLFNPFDLNKEINKKIHALSGGTLQKLNANLAFMFSPEIYIFDEPTAGLDPISNRDFKEFIKYKKTENSTIVITSHILSEIEQLVDDVIFLHEGKIRFNDTLEKLITNTKADNLENAIATIMEQNNE
jgi:Cu-processing system ATP-binding protein